MPLNSLLYLRKYIINQNQNFYDQNLQSIAFLHKKDEKFSSLFFANVILLFSKKFFIVKFSFGRCFPTILNFLNSLKCSKNWTFQKISANCGKSCDNDSFNEYFVV